MDSPVLPLPLDPVLGFHQSPTLDFDVFADSAGFVDSVACFVMNKLGATNFSDSVLPWAALFHVAPLPIAAAKVGD